MSTKHDTHLISEEGIYEVWGGVAFKLGGMKIKTVLVIVGAIKVSFLFLLPVTSFPIKAVWRFKQLS